MRQIFTTIGALAALVLSAGAGVFWN